ncbi:hypothetical protein [Nannocystis bainbridge]|uniref:Uncharacterized protein n=1 Tax=Nannocystis bainbridge TaxID=2995303 RepID=A0ABT5E8F5_9BACT|nr:hypothetical protein [Nannocystis bainbridge]MDC0721723.1 hypothetical protein [Nannocystis bainbridge]
MTPDLSCYGEGIRGLADLVGDFDLRSPMDVHAWYRVEWQAIAELLGFSQELEATLAPLRVVRDRVTATNQAGVDAFARWLRGQRPGLSDSHARTQDAVLAQLLAVGQERGELWRVTADPTTLAAGACYDDGGQLRRAFYSDTAPGYFGDGWNGPPPRAESACGWTTPLVLHLGTFPWVYSSRIDGTAVGARWASGATMPAITGMRAMARLLEPGGNLHQDARQVAAIFEHFTAHTAPLIARLPVYQSGRAVAGHLYRRAGFLYVHQGSLHLAGLPGPRGRIAAPAYNYALRRFACFFAVRRAALRALVALPSDIQRIAECSADPCLRRHVEEVARAG